jgi:hypothetical protein
VSRGLQGTRSAPFHRRTGHRPDEGFITDPHPAVVGTLLGLSNSGDTCRVSLGIR